MATMQVSITKKWWVGPSMSILVALYRATGFFPNAGRLVKFYADKGFIYALQDRAK